MTHVRFGASGIIFEDDFRFGAFRVGEGATTFSASDFLGCPFFAAMISSFFWFFESLINIIFFQIKIMSIVLKSRVYVGSIQETILATRFF